MVSGLSAIAGNLVLVLEISEAIDRADVTVLLPLEYQLTGVCLGSVGVAVGTDLAGDISCRTPRTDMVWYCGVRLLTLPLNGSLFTGAGAILLRGGVSISIDTDESDSFSLNIGSKPLATGCTNSPANGRGGSNKPREAL